MCPVIPVVIRNQSSDFSFGPTIITAVMVVDSGPLVKAGVVSVEEGLVAVFTSFVMLLHIDKK